MERWKRFHATSRSRTILPDRSLVAWVCRIPEIDPASRWRICLPAFSGPPRWHNPFRVGSDIPPMPDRWRGFSHGEKAGIRRQGSAEGFAPRMGSRHGRQGWLSEPSARRRSLTSLSRRTVAENQCATGILAVGISNPKSRAGMPVPHCKGTNVPPASLPVIFPAETA